MLQKILNIIKACFDFRFFLYKFRYYSIIEQGTDKILFSKARKAVTIIQKYLGLMFKKSISENEAVIFYNTRCIHTFHMRFPIDIIFLNREMQVQGICGKVTPGNKVFCEDAVYTIECFGGEADRKGIRVGQGLYIKRN